MQLSPLTAASRLLSVVLFVECCCGCKRSYFYLTALNSFNREELKDETRKLWYVASPLVHLVLMAGSEAQCVGFYLPVFLDILCMEQFSYDCERDVPFRDCAVISIKIFKNYAITICRARLERFPYDCEPGVVVPCRNRNFDKNIDNIRKFCRPRHAVFVWLWKLHGHGTAGLGSFLIENWHGCPNGKVAARYRR